MRIHTTEKESSDTVLADGFNESVIYHVSQENPAIVQVVSTPFDNIRVAVCVLSLFHAD